MHYFFGNREFWDILIQHIDKNAIQEILKRILKVDIPEFGCKLFFYLVKIHEN
jgi:hypothetical protein